MVKVRYEEGMQQIELWNGRTCKIGDEIEVTEQQRDELVLRGFVDVTAKAQPKKDKSTTKKSGGDK